MKHCIKLTSITSEEPPLTVGNPPELNPDWIDWCMLINNCTRAEAIRRGELRIGRPKPKRKFKP